VRDGGVIAPGHDAELDELRAIMQNCDAFLLQLEVTERARTGIGNLRVQYNKVHGFYIEVTQGQAAKVPADYRRRQTLKNAERYITPELKAFEDKALSAQERALAREKRLYDELLDRLAVHLEPLGGLARRAGEPRCAGGAGRARRDARLDPPAVRARAVHRHRRRPPSGRRGAPARDRRRQLHAERLPARRDAPDARHHRTEHGRQEHLHAAGRADRAARRDRLVRAGVVVPARARSTRSTPASAPPTTSPTRSRPSWSR
jgi:hypothetical protein